MKQTLFLFLISISTFAQNITGIATYQSKTNIDFNFESKQIPPEMMKQIQAKMKKSFEKTFTLAFNQNESLFEEEEQLETPGMSSGNIKMVTAGSFKSGKVYKNIEKESYKKESDISGKAFLIEDKLEPLEWELTDESKQIGQYIVFKAVAVQKIDTSVAPRFLKRKFMEKKKDKNDTITSPLDEFSMPKERKITAWYTPQIPIKTGPADYWGLPGLILEIQDGKTTILCSKIVINPKEAIDIKAPKKGKPVSRKEFAEIMNKKTEETMEMYKNKGGKDGFKIMIKN